MFFRLQLFPFEFFQAIYVSLIVFHRQQMTRTMIMTKLRQQQRLCWA